MTEKDIKILRLAYLRGPNIWTYRPVVEALVDIGALEDCPSNTLPGFTERLSAWLPGLAASPTMWVLAGIVALAVVPLMPLVGSAPGAGAARWLRQCAGAVAVVLAYLVPGALLLGGFMAILAGLSATALATLSSMNSASPGETPSAATHSR